MEFRSCFWLFCLLNLPYVRKVPSPSLLSFYGINSLKNLVQIACRIFHILDLSEWIFLNLITSGRL